MAINVLETKFVFIDSDLNKVDSTRKSLFALNTDLNNLGKNSPVGKTIADSIKPAETALDSLNKKLNDTDLTGRGLKDLSSELKAQASAQKAIEQAKRATIQTSITEIKLEREKIALQRESLALEKAQNNKRISRPPDNDLKAAFSDLRRIQAENLRAEKEITKQIERESKLQADIKIREGKRAANEALRTLTQNRTPNAQGLNLSSFQKQNLSYQINDVLTGLASGQPITQIAAQQSGQIAQIFNPAQAAALVATYGSLAAIAGAGATAIALTYKLTGDLRTQAEKRLSVEDSISAAINKQIFGLREAYADYEKFKRSFREDEAFANRLTSAVNTSDAIAAKREQEKVEANNKSRIAEIDRLRSDLAQQERSLEFAKNRNVNQGIFQTTLRAPEPITQGLFTTLGIERGYSASQKQQDVSQAESAVEKTKKALAETEAALEKGKSNLQQADKALIGIRERQDKAFSDRFEIFQKSQKDSQKYEISQFEEFEKKKKKIAETNLLKAEFNTFSAESSLTNNPFIKLFADGESAGERMEKRFRSLGDEYVKLATKIEQNNIAKKINALSYDSGKKSLNFEQDAFRTSRIRDNQFASFERALKTVETKVEFAVKTIELDRRISESYFYSARYNPNNPKSFDDSRFSFREQDRFADSAGSRRRGESAQEFEQRRREAIARGIRVNDAFDEISKLKNLSTDGTGIFGQGMIADKILERLPSREDLLTLLGSPYAAIRGKAQSLLTEQTKAFSVKRELENQKLNDFLYDQETAGLNKKFAYDQLALLNNQKGLSKGEYANNFLDITKNLGNDLDPYLRRGMYEQNLIAAKEERAKENEAREYWKAIALATAGLNEKLNQIISANGLKIDGSNIPATNVQVNAKDFDVKTDTGAAGTMEDMAANYFSDSF